MRVLISCDGATPSSHVQSEAGDQHVFINHQGPARDLNLRIENISQAVLRNVDDRASDFIRIASYVYAPDQSISRGGPADVYGRRWTREMVFVIPVLDANFWNQSDVHQNLIDVLTFLMGDSCRFEFTQAR